MAREHSRTGVGARITGPRLGCARGGFTLIELSITLAVIAVILSLLGPAVIRTMNSAKAFQCQSTLRAIGFDFALFADPFASGNRGADTTVSGGRFHLSTFVNSEYGLNEYWAGDAPSAQPRSPGSTGASRAAIAPTPRSVGQRAESPPSPTAARPIGDNLRCPEVASIPRISPGFSCTSERAVTPPAFVSYTFNARLHRAIDPITGQARSILLSEIVLEHSSVPLAWDVDGLSATERGARTPHFTAPSVSDATPTGLYTWAPDARHNSRVNVVFIDGHVEASADPAGERTWDWGHTPG